MAISPIYMQVFISFIFFLVFAFKIMQRKNVQFYFFLKSMFALFIVVCDTQYTSILGAFFKLFQCTNLDSTDSRQFLLFAPHIECYSENHIVFIFAVGLPCFLIWVIGLPIFYFFLLKIMRRTGGLRKATKEMCRFNPLSFENQPHNEKMSVRAFNLTGYTQKAEGMFEKDLDASIMLAFLYTDFKAKRYYWTSAIMIWKIVMCLIVNFISASYGYLTLFIFYCIVLTIYDKFKPYKDNSCLTLIKLSFFVNMISIILTLFNTSRNASFYFGLGIVYVLIQSLFFVVAGYLIIIDLDLSKYIALFGKYLSERKNAGKSVNAFGNKLMTNFSQRRRRSTFPNIVPLKNNEKLQSGEGIFETKNEILTEKKIIFEMEIEESTKRLEGNSSNKTKNKDASFLDDKNGKDMPTIIVMVESETNIKNS